MPELPEVETVRRGLEPALVGARFTTVHLARPDLRFPLPARFAARLTGQRVEALSRRAKYLVADLSSGDALIMHLGMSGRFDVVFPDGRQLSPGEFYLEGAPGQAKHDHVVFALSNGARVTYNDVRRFGFMDLVRRAELETCRHFAGMGIEPLGSDLSGEAVARLFRGRRTPLKAALLDQRLIAGLGNIYVCEALHRARLHPEAAAGTLADAAGRPTRAAARLAQVIRDVLTEAVAAGGSTLRDYAHTDGTQGAFQHRFRVYDREGLACTARGCRGRVRRIVQAGRSTFYCETCQPAP
ncbi:formamidopyrimidine-DNA glycosylase [Methylobacterium sp. 4-46]|uniref:Formamidopyrimidine-DNA glycosylase n=1 Tax=Methylobacterium sp. (strain 4-46) TaxID=426117 RepID=FPG_METS4|nr:MULTISPECIES: bifunctional DNA-formamidopyrimidine glycosylase/DNA-(apurinic or apyrimidinic site) lyase [Methylobacterium]B0UR68.1 RecName: Full=Formamidopyrimidine-DNA glycosylase; Short=Fapy-DNA glycosylase; AltName: Full=DNA-(apurinic or apyrimidinic site) lyase MutM; Short=AP lyase MutM [Methylobacterium sp. 4-46]ACA20520.1 formamidopyrimidine-DNA glycosylase [Methylobacterium sp. 4-46]WFT79686.1 bifunctional DNA-formamidopyrimidine glycosylase/DNA-(apurinic or apyrimidinic site) lyase [